MKIDMVTSGNYDSIYFDNKLYTQGNSISIWNLLYELSYNKIEVSKHYYADDKWFLSQYKRFPKNLIDVKLIDGNYILDEYEE